MLPSEFARTGSTGQLSTRLHPASRSGTTTMRFGFSTLAVSAMNHTPQNAITSPEKLPRLARQLQAIAHHVGQVLNLGILIMMRQNDGVPGNFQIGNFFDQGIDGNHEEPLSLFYPLVSCPSHCQAYFAAALLASRYAARFDLSISVSPVSTNRGNGDFGSPAKSTVSEGSLFRCRSAIMRSPM